MVERRFQRLINLPNLSAIFMREIIYLLRIFYFGKKANFYRKYHPIYSSKVKYARAKSRLNTNES